MDRWTYKDNDREEVMSTEFIKHLILLYEKHTPTFLLANGWPSEVIGG